MRKTDSPSQWDRSYQELLELAITDQMFPDAVLMPVGKTVGEVLRSV
ncbi:hypothetical protein [Deinococcus ruber]|nr:hypothetical protein [Deinococcus ruber]